MHEYIPGRRKVFLKLKSRHLVKEIFDSIKEDTWAITWIVWTNKCIRKS